MEDYEQGAEQFLKETNTEFKAEFVKKGLHFEDDKEPRNIFKITLKRGSREFSFMFGDSIANTEKALLNTPTAYDFLSCVQTIATNSFKDFCGEFGYSDDSIKALKTYEAVKEEYNKMAMLFNDEELEKLQEIQ